MNKLVFTSLLIIINFSVWSQKYEHSYKREITKVENSWHKIIVPEDLFSKARKDLSDIRILSLPDSSEAPYFIEKVTGGTALNPVTLKVINTSYNNKGYYYTLSTSEKEEVNRIQLDFNKKNFDWKLKLEGSSNNKEWFTIKDDYRIVSVENDWTNYSFTKVVFPYSKYNYYRISIKSKEDPELSSASISEWSYSDTKYTDYEIVSQNVSENKKRKQTIIELDLKHKAPLDYLKISFKDEIDFYRNIRVEYLVDSVKTQKGYHKNYRTLKNGIVTSFEENVFLLSGKQSNRIRITVENNDNEPLSFETAEVKGHIHEITARFNPDKSYALFYGNKKLNAPRYDISQLKKTIPEALVPLSLKTEEILEQKELVEKQEALFENQIWLWVLMGLIIVLLGWFSLNMVKGK